MKIDERAFKKWCETGYIKITCTDGWGEEDFRWVIEAYEAAKLPSYLQRNQEIFDMGVEHDAKEAGQPVELTETLEALRGLQKELQREQDSHEQTLSQRDAAQDAADELTSLVLGEPIDWAYHDEKWGEAIEKLQNEPKRESGWQPIETAPKDGTWFIGIRTKIPFVTSWDEGWFSFNMQYEKFHNDDWQPIYWMPYTEIGDQEEK